MLKSFVRFFLKEDEYFINKKDKYYIESCDFIENDKENIKRFLTEDKFMNLVSLKCCIFSSILYKYKDCSWVETFLEFLNIENYTIHLGKNGLVYGLFLDKYKTCYLVFKGSTTFSDFFQDSKITLVKIKNIDGKVHKGFSEMMVNNYDDIKINLQSFCNYNSVRKIYVTGHSLGGALSTIFYKIHKDSSDIFIKHVTFGSPRIGNKEFCKNIDSIRVVNKADFVTMIPFSFNYLHIDYKQPIGETYKLLSIKDHFMEEYYKSIKNFFLKIS